MQFLPIEEKILAKLTNESLSEKERIRLRYGFYLVSDAIKKGILIYSPVILLGIFFEVLFMHISFLIIRQVTFGWHGGTHISCLAYSLLAFVGIPILLQFVSIPFTTLLIVSLIVFGSILWIGPRGTKVNTLSDKAIKMLRRKLLVRSILLWLFFCFFPFAKEYILLGVTVQLIALIVQTYINQKS